MKILNGAVTMAMLAFAITSHAQIIEKKSLNLEGAKKAIAAAVDYAKKSNAPGGVIAVVDEGGNLMALERLDGTDLERISPWLRTFLPGVSRSQARRECMGSA